MVDFKGLEAVYWTIKLGSVTAAADKLNTTQPAISARIIQTEDEFGVKLFDRSQRSVIPNIAGREVADYAERMLRMRAEMIHSISDNSRIAQNFRLGLGETIAHTWLPKLVDKIGEYFPKLTLEIDVDTAAYLRERLLLQKLDLAFFIGSSGSSTAISQPLCNFSLRFFASPNLMKEMSGNLAEDFSRFPIMTYARMTQPYAYVSEFLSDPLFRTPKLHASSSIAVVVNMAIASMGIAAIPKELVEGPLKRNELVELTIPFSLPDLAFSAFWLPGPQSQLPERIFALALSVAANENIR
ncbi:LysR family transcriptional regulator [uncultured Agrobacterium sp.]|uniref:LysR family transcriptional regulator n=1 Tax=uncultured Agrobacterium sp. TaxID=157277 RepID=UPI0025ECD755|nr:LysR family transcriptional regulator [uncultured Agrobacterium sp.]